MGLAPMSLFLTCALVVRNLAVADASRHADQVKRPVLAALRQPSAKTKREQGGDQS
jgi:hypothetical protein